jgi:hypothetical protein
MKVFVNDKEIVLFQGAKVKDAILSFDKSLLKKMSLYEVSDKYGNQTEIDGALQDGSKLFITEIVISRN